MSFASGFNSGVNILAGLRASANQRRDLELQERRDKVLSASREIQADAIEEEMKRQREVYEREQTERLASNFVLGKFSEQVRGLDLTTQEGFREYSDLSAKAAASIRDPEARQRFQLIDNNYRTVGMSNGFKKMADARVQRAIEAEELSRELLDMGHPVDSADSEKLQEFRNWKNIQKMLGDDISGESVGLDTEGPFVSNKEMVNIKREIREVGAKRYADRNLSPEERQRNSAIDAVERVINDGGSVADIIAASKLGKDMDTSTSENINDAFLAIDLTGDVESAMENLGVPTGKGFGEFFADLKSAVGQDQDVTAFRASLTRLIPKLARGVFGEVGVLTDTDIDNYMRTVASLKNTKGSNRILMESTKSLVARGIRNKLTAEAASGTRVSQFARQLEQIGSVPMAVYMSTDSVESKLENDIRRGFVRPGDTISIWDGKSTFHRTKVKTLKEYGVE